MSSSSSKRCIAVALSILGSAAAQANSYTIVDLGGYMIPSRIDKHGDIAGWAASQVAYVYRGKGWHRLGCGGQAAAIGIDAKGDTVGYSDSSPMLWPRAGGCMALPMPAGATSGIARGIAADGTVVGHFSLPNDGVHTHCFIDRPDGTSQDLGLVGTGLSCDVGGIGRQSQVVGTADTTPEGASRAFVWQDGQFQFPALLPGASTSAGSAINVHGHVVGTDFMASGGSHAFLWTGGHPMDLDPSGSHYKTIANDISDGGEIVGYGVSNVNGPVRAIRFAGGEVVPLESEVPDLGGWRLIYVYAVNAAGEIVGYGQLDGKWHGFMLVPQANR
jgi:probable HAF family extracellular repeat protein